MAALPTTEFTECPTEIDQHPWNDGTIDGKPDKTVYPDEPVVDYSLESKEEMVAMESMALSMPAISGIRVMTINAKGGTSAGIALVKNLITYANPDVVFVTEAGSNPAAFFTNGIAYSVRCKHSDNQAILSKTPLIRKYVAAPSFIDAVNPAGETNNKVIICF